jgi:hypothetical protein
MDDQELERSVRLLAAHRAIEQKIYRMGYALEDGDFALVGLLCGSAATDGRLRRGSDHAVN